MPQPGPAAPLTPAQETGSGSGESPEERRPGSGSLARETRSSRGDLAPERQTGSSESAEEGRSSRGELARETRSSRGELAQERQTGSSESAEEGPASSGSLARGGRADGLVLLASIFLLAISGLVYELIAGTLSSYLLGDSVTQFSLVIGLFLTAMGAGSWASRLIRSNLLAWFAAAELAVGLVGGLAPLISFAAFSMTELYMPVLFGFCWICGMLVGIEIPLMIRILRQLGSLRITVANVLAADYLGAFFASVLFPFALLPHLGLVRAGLVMGLSNVAVTLLVLTWFRRRLGASRFPLAVGTLGIGAVLIGSFFAAGQWVRGFEDRIYQDEIVLARDTQYQRMIVTRWREDVRLYLDGHLQFSTVDEYRYHEALVHPAMSTAARRQTVLILGGGDGMAVREVLKYPEVQQVDLVDLDPAVTELFRDREWLAKLNGLVLRDPRVRIHNQDALRFLEQSTQLYDVILIDLPDPSRPELGKLYSRPFYSLAGRHLAEGGALVTQSTSPYQSRAAFWCIAHTLQAARWGQPQERRFEVAPYHTVVPTFGTWGFILAAERKPDPASMQLKVPTRYLSPAILPTLFVFPPDMAELSTPVSELNDPKIVRLYVDGYHRYLN